MGANKHNADKAPEVTPQESNVPSTEQVEEVSNETPEIKEDVVIEEDAKPDTEKAEEVEEEQADESFKSVSIEMGFKEDVVPPNPNDVRFKVKYKNSFEGVKRHNEGDIIVISKESAEMFKEKGIGQIIK